MFNDQDNEFENIRLPNLDSITNKKSPTMDKEISNKQYVDDELNKNNTLTFNHSVQNYLKVTVANSHINHTKSERTQITDTMSIKF